MSKYVYIPGHTLPPCLWENTQEPLLYIQDYRILECGIGLTDLVKRPTRSSVELSPGEARAGVLQLQTKLVAYTPRVVCCNGTGVTRARSTACYPPAACMASSNRRMRAE